MPEWRRGPTDTTIKQAIDLRNQQDQASGAFFERLDRPSHGRKDAFLNQPFAEFDAVFVVDVQQSHGDAAGWRQADQVGTFPFEMPGPFVAAGS